jgi:hypothetical protein
MQQIADWLEKLGMSEYAQRFAENGIDDTVLPDLTDQDLKDIVVLLGHRRKVLRAIAELNNAATTAMPAPPPVMSAPIPAAVAPPPISARVEAAGERRHVTVMFCDLVDSTGIAAKLDAEEWRDLVGAYLDAATAAVTEMGGKVAKKLGDGLMALFGYPLAQENDGRWHMAGNCRRCRSRWDNAADVAQTVRAAALSPQVYGWFTEGFGTRDLKEAKALLEELGA